MFKKILLHKVLSDGSNSKINVFSSGSVEQLNSQDGAGFIRSELDGSKIKELNDFISKYNNLSKTESIIGREGFENGSFLQVIMENGEHFKIMESDASEQNISFTDIETDLKNIINLNQTVESE